LRCIKESLKGSDVWEKAENLKNVIINKWFLPSREFFGV